MSTGIICTHCGRPITDGLVWVGDFPYHTECTHGPSWKPQVFKVPSPTSSAQPQGEDMPSAGFEPTTFVSKAELAALRADRDRLDWMEKNGGLVGMRAKERTHDDTGVFWAYESGEDFIEGKTIRAAIDAARQGGAK